MKILIAAPEAVPYAKTGGLADVAGALLKEFRDMGEDACIIMPLYRRIRENFRLDDTGLKIKAQFESRSVSGRIFSYSPHTGRHPGAYFVECNEFFDREDLYGTPAGDYKDNSSRFIFFSRGILEACKALNFMPDVIHCNDWQTGLVPFYLKTIYRSDRFFRNTAAIITVHNLGYQGLFPASEMPLTGLDPVLFTPEGIEFYGKMNFLKAGIISADFISTVSSNYAREILTEEYGFGLDGVLRRRASSLTGIINGIDCKEWNPLSDAFLPKNYGVRDIAGKMTCKLQLMKECSIKAGPETPVIGMVGRLSSQKGLDILLESVGEIISMGASLIILGKGDEIFQRRLSEVSGKYKGRVCVNIGFQDDLAHRIYAGSDIFLMPSRYEPCGLGQMIAMRYGTVPVARRTGGLADTISDYQPLRGKGTGFLFSDHTPSALKECLNRALCVYINKERWCRLIKGAMRMDFSWRSSAEKYIELYEMAMRFKRK